VELSNCGKTVQLKRQDVAEKDDWVVNVFGADIGVGKAWEAEHISPSKADSLVRQMNFYQLIQQNQARITNNIGANSNDACGANSKQKPTAGIELLPPFESK
jgi:hypothetical protein